MIDEQDLMECVFSSLPDTSQLKPGDVTFQRTTTGKFNDSFFVKAGEKDYVLRVAPPDDAGFVFYEYRMMRQEPELHRLLREKTSVPVAEIIAFDQTRKVIPRDFIFMERLPGVPISNATNLDYEKIMRQVGQALAEVHAITRKNYGYLGAHQPMAAQDNWVDAFRIMWQTLLDDVVACGMYTHSEADSLLRFFDHASNQFETGKPASLLHMDVWAQNILVDGNSNLTGLVDWDRAVWGDPEIEFAVLDYCGISTPAFWEGYGKSREQTPQANLRGVFYFLYELQKYIVICVLRKKDREAAGRYKKQVHRFLSQIEG